MTIQSESEPNDQAGPVIGVGSSADTLQFMANAMEDRLPLRTEEVVFVTRIMFETLCFDEPIDKSAERCFQELGLQNGAIENFHRVMGDCHLEILSKIYERHEPPAVQDCPWKNQRAFLARDTEMRDWLKSNGVEPAEIEPFIRDTLQN
ncbi:hypothetical protein GCM10023156_04950 [Novipirellula rosea]|uniref:Uncharacterized protein n=1 Tax=Novipirellula rosea TaxID=1031540 RepID=A0ABP8M8Z0_9BACT